MTINGYSLKEIINNYRENIDKNYKENILKDYFERNYTWEKFENICKSKTFKNYFESYFAEIQYLDHSKFHDILYKNFPVVFQETSMPLTLKFNICFNIIKNNNKQLEFNFG